MTLAKIDLSAYDIAELPSRFPYPGVLKGRSPAAVEAILDDPATFFGEPVEIENPDGTVVTSDPCPDGARGFAWWPVVDLSPPLGLLETHGMPEHAVDIEGRRATALAPVIEPSPEALTEAYGRIEIELHRRIDIEAENRRLDFITPGDGQAQTYRLKTIEAEAIVAGAVPSKAAHPFVWKEAGALGVTPEIRASQILAMRDAWASVGSDIEAARQGAKAAVTKAKGNQKSMEAAAVVDWAVMGAN